MRQCDVHGGRYLAAGDPLCFAKAGSLLAVLMQMEEPQVCLGPLDTPALVLTQGSRPFREAFEASWGLPTAQSRCQGECRSGFAS